MSKLLLAERVFPSNLETVSVEVDNDTYGGAHKYTFQNSLGYDKDKGGALYDESEQTLQFVQKDTDGKMIPGVQSEQLLIALKDRHTKLNNKFPAPTHEKFMAGIQMALDACQERVQERMDRDVMGELKE